MKKEISVQLQQGLTFHRAGQFEQASAVYSEIVKLDPKNFDALRLLGTIAAQTQQYEKAVELLTQALSVNQKNATVYTNLGNALKELNRFDEALANYAHALAIDPNDAQTYSNLGASLLELDRVHEALSYFEKAITIKPDFAEAFYNQGVAFKKLNLLDQAVSSYERAIAIQPNYAHAHSNLGRALQELLRLDKAIEHFERAIATQPDYAQAYLNKSLIHLLIGEFERGWALYEWRWKSQDIKPHQRHFSQPLWLGIENIANKTLLLHSEQGLGDSIQFCRYAQLVKNLGAHTLLEVPKSLIHLFKDLAGVDTLLEQGQPLPAFDYHCPLLSLPLAFQTELSSIPTSTPYLFSCADKRAHWNRQLPPKRMLRVGLVWRGNAQHKNDHNRSLALQELLMHLPDHCDYVSLQKEPTEEDQKVLKNNRIQHFEEQIEDFTDTAALCDLMDVVISVDTSVAHLASALGKKTWILLPYVPDWRWLLDRDDSPWYSCVRLYRQGKDRQWGPALASIATALARLS